MCVFPAAAATTRVIIPQLGQADPVLNVCVIQLKVQTGVRQVDPPGVSLAQMAQSSPYRWFLMKVTTNTHLERELGRTWFMPGSLRPDPFSWSWNKWSEMRFWFWWYPQRGAVQLGCRLSEQITANRENHSPAAMNWTGSELVLNRFWTSSELILN